MDKYIKLKYILYIYKKKKLYKKYYKKIKKLLSCHLFVFMKSKGNLLMWSKFKC